MIGVITSKFETDKPVVLWLVDVMHKDICVASTKPQPPARTTPVLEAPDDLAAQHHPRVPHPTRRGLVVLTDTLDWTEMEARAEKIGDPRSILEHVRLARASSDPS